ncbi:DUF4261 domain-containing protein [Gordonia neofelifaecis]|uniref:DUF4261 domain-containing protein n=1 Tax=Gordonia neofelifaecis NRRL B-59395 TaxID=644548 RepID=F1YML1_9ACTN|nr:DUF4261 domain-containing protein [Gordonia neofelifaecis]EGD53946.1 hypothetical protein SCNU_15784 [Gordonia neofelifaecis NRRL B-59395]
MDPLLVTLFSTRIDTDLTAEALLDQLRADWGELLNAEFDSVVVGIEEVSDDPEAPSFGLSVQFDDVRVLIADFDAPYELEIAEAAEASPLWDADSELPDVDGPSLVVTVLPEVSADVLDGDEEAAADLLFDQDRDLIAEATLISRVVTSLVACTDSIQAVYMHTSEQIADPAAYRAAALDVSPDLPLMLWVDFMVAEEGGVVSGETIGMSELGLLDIEISDSTLPAEHVVKVIVDTAVLMYDDGLVIADGDTLESEVGHFIAHIGPSKYDPDHLVLQLESVAAAPANRAERRAAARKKKR